jgi:predicted permease
MLDLRNVWLPPVVGFVTISFGYVVAMGFARVAGRGAGLRDAVQKRTFALGVGTFNYGYIPIPLVQSLFDEGTLGVLLVHNIGVEMALWTAGMLTLAGGLGRGWWKRLINPPLIAVAAALLLNFTGLHEHLPRWFEKSVGMVGQSAIPIALILIGATIADQLSNLGLRRGYLVVVWASVLRLGVLPLILVPLAMGLPIPLELQRVMVIEAAMPAAVFPVVMARHYGGDAGTAVLIALGSSVVSLFTIPLWLMTLSPGA